MKLKEHILFRNRITREIKKTKKEYYKNYFQVNMNNMKNLWKGIKNILNINTKGDSNISQLSLDGKTITGNKDGSLATVRHIDSPIVRQIDSPTDR